MVLPPFWSNSICNDSSRRRVNFQALTIIDRLHPAQYPWEHQKWTKTFDHQA